SILAWSSNPVFTNVMPGTITIWVRDMFGCTTTTTIVMPATPTPVITNAAVINADCGESNGRITVTAMGGTPPLMYSLNGGPFGASNVFSNLPAGAYVVTV